MAATIIKVLVSTLPGGYGPILQAYNENKPAEWNPIRELERSEGGFEMDLTENELKISNASCSRFSNSFMDDHDEIKQMRWCQGELHANTYIGFNAAETKLLFQALQKVLGADKVKMI
jgi:hypothetical protein